MRLSLRLLLIVLIVALAVAPVTLGDSPASNTAADSLAGVGLLDSITLYPAYDTYVSSYSSGSTYCYAGELRASNGIEPDTGAYLERSYIGFNITGIPSNAIVDSAYLFAYCSSTVHDITSRPVYLRRVTSSWTCPNWGSKPGSSSWTSTSISGTGWYNWNVTSLVDGWLGRNHNTSPNFGFELRSTESGSNYWRYFHSNQGSNKPYLRINYRLPTATPTASRTRTPTLTATPSRTPTATRTNTPYHTYTPSNTPTNTATRTNTPTQTPTPTATLRPGIVIDKRQIEPLGLPFHLGDEIFYEIVVHNSGASPLKNIALTDDFDADILDYVSANPPPDDVDNDLGLLTWHDITAPGDLAPGETITIEVRLRAVAVTVDALAWNCAIASDIVDIYDQSLPSRRDCLIVAVVPLPELAVVKEPRDPVVCLGDMAQFYVAVGNVGTTNLGSLEMGDSYDPAILEWISDPYWVQSAPGEIGWGPGHFAFGAGGPGWSAGYPISFDTLSPSAETIDKAWAIAMGREETRQEASAGITILAEPGPCDDNAVRNPGFETGNIAFWEDLTDGLVRFVPDAHSGAYAALLGILPEEPDRGRMDFLCQELTVPADSSSATLSFWFNVSSEDMDRTGNSFQAVLTQPSGVVTEFLLPPTVNTDGWRRAAFDLSAYVGQHVGICFAALNDGSDLGTLRAYVDDVELCARTCGPPLDLNPGDPDGGICWPGGLGLVDYAPNGMPDFDMAPYVQGAEALLADGPAAVLNALWWLDSRAEEGTTQPPGISDSHDLIVAQGAWDDHDPRNVAPMIDVLADYMRTGDRGDPPGQDQGTLQEDMVSGLRAYIADKGLADDYAVNMMQVDSSADIRHAVAQNYGVILRLSFSEYQPDGWRTLGHHWVTAAGIDCLSDNLLAISDPALDGAEIGRRGEIWPAAGHMQPHEADLHDDAAYLSHDVYRIGQDNSVGGTWGCLVSDYMVPSADNSGLEPGIAPFYHANASSEHTVWDPNDRYQGGPIRTVIQSMVAIIPLYGQAARLELRPDLVEMQVGEATYVDIVVISPERNVTAMQAYLDYDPEVLEIGYTEFAFSIEGPYDVLQNEWGANPGEANLALGVRPGGDPVNGVTMMAMTRVRALQPTGPEGTTIEFNFGEPRFSNIFAGIDPILGGVGECRVIVTEPASLRGIVDLEGRPDAPHASRAISLTVELIDSDTGATKGIYGVNTDQAGTFDLAGLDAGYCDVRVKSMHSVASLARGVQLRGGMTTAVNLGTLHEGDVDNDNDVDATDATLLNRAFGTIPGSDDWDERADLNGDAVVDAIDYALLSASYGLSGDQMVIDPGPASRAAEAGMQSQGQPGLSFFEDPARDGTVALGFDPQEQSCEIGEIITVQLTMSTGAQEADTVDINISFPPASLQLVDAAGDPVLGVEAGTALGLVLANAVDNSGGTLHLAATKPGGSVSGDVLLAMLRFRAIGPAPNARLRYMMYQPSSDVWFKGHSVLGSWPASTVHVNGVAEVRLPIIRK